MRFSRLAGETGLCSRLRVSARHNSWPSVSDGQCSLSSSRMVLSLASSSSAYVQAPISTSPDLWSSLDIRLSPLVLCPGNARHFSFSGLSAPPSHLRDVPSPSSLPISSWVTSPTLVVSTHASTIHCLMLCLEKHCFIWFVWICGCLRQEGKTVSVTPLWTMEPIIFYTHRMSWLHGPSQYFSIFKNPCPLLIHRNISYPLLILF